MFSPQYPSSAKSSTSDQPTHGAKERRISRAGKKIRGVPSNRIMAAAMGANPDSRHALQLHLEVIDIMVLRKEVQDIG
jgi:hypothetical protein